MDIDLTKLLTRNADACFNDNVTAELLVTIILR